MNRRISETCCGRRLDDKETRITDAGLDEHEISVLALARFYLQSFSMPQSHAWIGCLETAQAQYGEVDGMIVAGRVLRALKAMRCTRRSMFCFNSPTCAGCAKILTEHERRLIFSLAALRRGREGTAQTELMMLCEGSDIGLRRSGAGLATPGGPWRERACLPNGSLTCARPAWSRRAPD